MGFLNWLGDVLAGPRSEAWYSTQIKKRKEECKKLQQILSAKKTRLDAQYYDLLQHPSEVLKGRMNSQLILVRREDRGQLQMAFEIVRLQERIDELNANIADLMREKKEKYPTIH